MNTRIVFLFFAVLFAVLNFCSAAPTTSDDVSHRQKRQFGYPGGYGGYGGGYGGYGGSPVSQGSFNAAGIGVGGNNSGVISGGQGGGYLGK